MVCCCGLSFFQGSKPWTWMALLVPASALFVRLSSFHGKACVFIPLSVLFLAIFRQKPLVQDNSLVQPKPQKPDVFLSEQEVSDEGRAAAAAADQEEASLVTAADGNNGQGFLIRSSQDLYSESESIDHFSSTTLSEEDSHSSDTEWPCNAGGRRGDWSDDEDSLFEIAIPSGLSVKDHPRFHSKNWKLQPADSPQQQEQATFHKDFLSDINEDNLIEIDINMGSIKCSSFTI